MDYFFTIFGYTFHTSPLLPNAFAPIYLIVVNIWCDLKYKCKFPVWRVFHCALILALGEWLSYLYICNWFIAKGEVVDMMTGILIYYMAIISIILVAVALVVYQSIVIIVCYMSKKNKKENE